jgi:glycosyltransferase involved in cell wall biosynthesis
VTRVLWLTPDKPADISVGRRRIADHLEQSGFEVTLRGTTARVVFRSLRERDRYDVVVGTTRIGAIAGIAVQFAGGPPLIVDHIDPIRQFALNNSAPLTWAVRVAETVAFRLSAATLFVYEEERPRVERQAPRAIRTALGVEYDRFASPAPAVIEQARMRLAGTINGRIAVYVGGLEPIYNVETMLDAIDFLEGWDLLIIGTGSLVDEVEQRAADRSCVHYIGTVPHEEIPGYLAAADVGVSLVDDPHTLKVLEYGAAGLPTVQLEGYARRRFGDRVEYCEDDPTSVAAAIERAVDRDPSPLREMAASFDWSAIAETYASVITSVK